MKSIRVILCIGLVFLMSALSIEPDDRDRTAYYPVLMNKDDLPASVFNLPAREFENPGKIYIHEGRIYIIDLFKGIHVIDNLDPENPQKIGFIYIPGVMDMAIKGHFLFADNAIDLVAVDISGYPQIEVLDRKEAVFPEPTPPDMDWIPWAYSAYKRPKNTVIVAWTK